MKYLVTGCSGFIGFHLSRKLLKEGNVVIGIDNLNNYSKSRKIKLARLRLLVENKNFYFYKKDVSKIKDVRVIFDAHKIDKICHLAAQAGVRYSIDNPFLYEKSNNLGFLNILELAKEYKIQNLVFASSSSVYGSIKDIPYSEEMKVNKVISFYAATKAANELYAHVYHSIYKMNIIGLRFFTVYGPWGRPDMSYYLFADAIIRKSPIKVFNHGDMKRDFTYVDDIVDGICKTLNKVEKIGFGIFNLGNSNPCRLLDYISILENEFGRKVEKELLPMQQGDMRVTCADVRLAKKMLGFNPKTDLKTGLRKFVAWYKDFYNIK